jgi:hypothetical protein
MEFIRTESTRTFEQCLGGWGGGGKDQRQVKQLCIRPVNPGHALNKRHAGPLALLYTIYSPINALLCTVLSDNVKNMPTGDGGLLAKLVARLLATVRMRRLSKIQNG